MQHPLPIFSSIDRLLGETLERFYVIVTNRCSVIRNQYMAINKCHRDLIIGRTHFSKCRRILFGETPQSAINSQKCDAYTAEVQNHFFSRDKTPEKWTPQSRAANKGNLITMSRWNPDELLARRDSRAREIRRIDRSATQYTARRVYGCARIYMCIFKTLTDFAFDTTAPKSSTYVRFMSRVAHTDRGER